MYSRAPNEALVDIIRKWLNLRFTLWRRIGTVRTEAAAVTYPEHKQQNKFKNCNDEKQICLESTTFDCGSYYHLLVRLETEHNPIVGSSGIVCTRPTKPLGPRSTDHGTPKTCRFKWNVASKSNVLWGGTISADQTLLSEVRVARSVIIVAQHRKIEENCNTLTFIHSFKPH